ncbi:hypothetical protein [Streptomyces sp. UNOB3_S3]|uniref:hypothetical protein n=1 Tax=Streptomyces sp. UNOB3_S3 TaxID=2871682 RepID=UPI001E340594|nr:hypothetical protein [Streptomyces sp. UNOB3_S3]MCC3776803.1 hypothetical protein [Streptomyces sp. UNOB3_S3]
MVNGTAAPRRHRALGAATVSAIATVVLAGCSGSSSDEGKELRFGETASLTGYKDAKLDVTVDRLEQGGSADLSVLKDASKYAGKTPYYLRYKLTKTEAGKSGGASTYFSVTDANKKRLSKLTIIGALDTTGDPKNPLKYRGFDKCESLSTSDFEKAAPGQSVTGCAVYVADAGAGVPTVTWEQGTKTLATWK